LWIPVGLNPCWRICKYEVAGHFAPHYDGPYIESSEKRSLKTLNMYLNGGFEGGTTNFISDSQSLYKDESGKYRAEEDNVLFKIVPETGLALIFNHRILHEGEALRSGVKYLMRSDIMFERQSPPDIPDEEKKALEYLKLAEEAERTGDCHQSVEYYRKAMKLWPPLRDGL